MIQAQATDEATEPTPQATICITCHNYERFVGAAIESALAQDYPAVEIVVVDDGSTDGSRQVIERFGARIKARFLTANSGQNVAINEAVAMARGELVFLLDADDAFLPGKVSRIMGAYRQHPDGALFNHGLLAGNADLSATRPDKIVQLQGDIAPRLIRSHGQWPFMPTSAIAMPKRILDRVLPLPAQEATNQPDLVLSIVAPHLGAVVAVNEALAIRRLHGSNIYLHDDRLAGREWTRRDNIQRTLDGLTAANAILARLGKEIRYDPQRHGWVVRMRYELGEASTAALLRSQLANPGGEGILAVIAKAFRTWRTARSSRRRIRRNRMREAA